VFCDHQNDRNGQPTPLIYFHYQGAYENLTSPAVSPTLTCCPFLREICSLADNEAGYKHGGFAEVIYCACRAWKYFKLLSHCYGTIKAIQWLRNKHQVFDLDFRPRVYLEKMFLPY